MTAIKTECALTTYPDDEGPNEVIIIKSHWNFKDRVVLSVGGKDYTLIARDLNMAIANAVNSHR